MLSAIFRITFSSSGSGLEAGTTGTLAATAICRADILSPNERIIADDGPTKVIPAATQESAKSGFSDSKP